jgi:Protein of unknown function (DUF1569)
MNDGRRTLSFSNLFEVMPEVDRLLASHRTVGNWSLGQVCNHLSAGIILSVDGYPMKAPWIIRKTIGPIVRGRILKSGRIPDGIKLRKDFEPRPQLDARAEAEALRAAIQGFGAHAGPMAEHPFFGSLTRENWERLHAIHAAHHLGFVLPGSTPA